MRGHNVRILTFRTWTSAPSLSKALLSSSLPAVFCRRPSFCLSKPRAVFKARNNSCVPLSNRRRSRVTRKSLAPSFEPEPLLGRKSSSSAECFRFDIVSDGSHSQASQPRRFHLSAEKFLVGRPRRSVIGFRRIPDRQPRLPRVPAPPAPPPTCHFLKFTHDYWHRRGSRGSLTSLPARSLDAHLLALALSGPIWYSILM